MKKTILFITSIAVCVLLISSCKKSSSSNSNYYVKFKLNDSLITWNKFVNAETVLDLFDSTITDFDLASGSNDQNTTLSLDLNIHAKNLLTGTYTNTDQSLSMYTEYNLNNNSSNVVDFEIENVNGMPPSTFTITISSITSTEIRGTFTGNYLANVISGNTVSITDGEFFSPLIRY